MPELISCPSCDRQLRVPDNLLGKAVKCPTCGATFTAQAGGGTAAPPPAPEAPWPEPAPRREPEPQQEAPPEEEAPERDYEDDRPSRRRRRMRRDLEQHRGTMILIFGILGIVLCPILAPFAWVMGNTDLQKIRSGRMDPEGEGTTQAGKICGMIGTILFLLQFCCGIAYIVLIVVVAANDPNAFK